MRFIGTVQTIGKHGTRIASDLCVECGLCCDGSLFSEVELASEDESSDLEAADLSIDDADEDEPALLMQPCGARCGTRCSIYSQRPECCRTFECKLLHQFRSGMLSAESAQSLIAQMREQIRNVRRLITSAGGTNSGALQEDYFDAVELLSQRNGEESELIVGQLRLTMRLVNKSIRKHFLDC